MKLLVFILIAFIFPQFSYAQSSIRINEFSIEPDQKVELWNKGALPVDLSNWYIDDNGGTTFFTIPQNTLIYPNACVTFSANLNLNKSSADEIRLFDATAPPTSASAELIDNFAYSKSSGSNVSWLRLPDGENLWATGSASFGLSNSLGIPCVIFPTTTPSLTPNPTIPPSTTPSPTITETPAEEEFNRNCLHLSEIMPRPSNGPEWVELFNTCGTDITLSHWYIDDGESIGSTPKIFSLKIGARTYGTIDLTSSMLNNDSDSVRLLDSDQIMVESIEYENIGEDKSYSKTDFENNNSWCVTTPSKDFVNNNCTLSPTSIIEQDISSAPFHSINVSTVENGIQIIPTPLSPYITIGVFYQKPPDSRSSVLGVNTTQTFPIELKFFFIIVEACGCVSAFLNLLYFLLCLVSSSTSLHHSKAITTKLDTSTMIFSPD